MAQHERRDYEEGRLTLDQWLSFIRDVLGGGNMRRIGLLVHDYGSSLETEELNILGREEIKLKQLSTEHLARMKRDVLYEFVS